MICHSNIRPGVYLIVFLSLASYSSVDAWWFNSLAGLTSDILQRPFESLSLFALKSYFLGHLGGRVSQYRQMMQQQQLQQQQYNAPNQNRPYQSQNYNYQNNQPYGNVHNTRPRRSPVEDDFTAVPSEQFLEMAEKFDVDKCIPRLVCEVMAGSVVTERSQFEDLVVKVFGEETPVIKGEQKLFSSIYHYAAFAGKNSHDIGYCQQLFPKCKASDNEFRKLAEKIFSAVDDDEDDVAQ